MFKALKRYILVKVLKEGKHSPIVMSERPLRKISDNPSVQSLPPGHLAVLEQNLGEVIEVRTAPAIHFRHPYTRTGPQASKPVYNLAPAMRL